MDDTDDENDAVHLFRMLYVALIVSILTILINPCLFVLRNIFNLIGDRTRLLTLILLIALWIPFVFAFVCMITFYWGDDPILTFYGRPVSVLVAVGGSLTFTTFLAMELIFAIVLLDRDHTPYVDHVTNNGNDWIRKVWEKSYRHAGSENSLELESQSEKSKGENV